MTEPDDSPEPPLDPEVEALLDFPPVVRKCVRQDGWTPERQRGFIRALVVLGNAEQAAIAVEGTMSGVYKLRTAAGGGPFAASWDSALALHFRRNPKPEPKGRPSRGEIESGVGRKPWPARDSGPSSPRFESPEAEMRAREELFEKIIRKYWLKVGAERKARREGRIVAADFYVRQLTHIELVLEAGGYAHEVLRDLRLGGRKLLDVVATPISLLLDHARRLIWSEDGEPERPPLPRLGRHDDRIAIGEPSECEYSSGRDGDYRAWVGRQAERIAIAREAQEAWEARARAEAEAWAKRAAAKGPGTDSADKEEEEQ